MFNDKDIVTLENIKKAIEKVVKDNFDLSDEFKEEIIKEVGKQIISNMGGNKWLY